MVAMLVWGLILVILVEHLHSLLLLVLARPLSLLRLTLVILFIAL
jgi:hypothetical protein